MPRDDYGLVRPPGASNGGGPRKPRRRWGRWLLLLLLSCLLLDEIFTVIDFAPPHCGHARDEEVKGEVRNVFRTHLIHTLDEWGELYWRFNDGRVLRIDLKVLSSFGEDFEQVKWKLIDRISVDTIFGGVEYPAPPYLDEVRRELAEKYSPDHGYLRGDFIASSCEMMAAVVLTPESYARYRAEEGLPTLASLPPVPEHHPE